jgi:hypothetical protein
MKSKYYASMPLALLGSILLTSARAGKPVVPPDHNIPTITDAPTLCLALSGGGLRAGATALGVIQRLHEIGTLKDFSYVSSVSGGGYPVYGILYALNRGLTADQILKEDGRFMKRIGKNPVLASVNRLVAKSIVSGALVAIDKPLRGVPLNPGEISMSNGSAAYEGDIHTVFTGGYINMFGLGPNLADIRDPRPAFPYPIFLASANEGSTAPSIDSYLPSQLFELSPGWFGSADTGYWRNFPTNIGLADALSVSAAAVDAPNLKFDDTKAPLPTFIKSLSIGLGGTFALPDGNKVYLADGGFIENQAILPLAMRRCQEILALDATSDIDASFKAVERVRAYLQQAGWNVSKLAPIDATRSATVNSGWDLPSHVWTFSASTAQHSFSTNITILKLGIVLDHNYPAPTQSYLNKHWMGPKKRAPTCGGKDLAKWCDFPLENTVQQSYSVDEFRAYRFLGRELVDVWHTTVATQPSARR